MGPEGLPQPTREQELTFKVSDILANQPWEQISAVSERRLLSLDIEDLGSLHFSQSRHPETHAGFRNVVQYAPREMTHRFMRNYFLDWSAEGAEISDRQHPVTFDIDHVLDVTLLRLYEAKRI